MAREQQRVLEATRGQGRTTMRSRIAARRVLRKAAISREPAGLVFPRELTMVKVHGRGGSKIVTASAPSSKKRVASESAVKRKAKG